ncbi:aminodeoxychorismate synthase component I [Ancylobacter dichloromethanicus]|uniref:aminodeoxychorismate synthase n=1 Tax=Ancylobacter dichloromethanicus TaxID=518825 RepID=A0A9W6MXX2_9HYPH|nr:aminodeoxychorismate synthase component I [Ancylobacter dichloromethanicus]MBS7553925.1 aminodeoxychorismate synthase component I [Ancylobacter dichloromethanicus]GLK71034.1 aminodeoxychorismate synthase, component I [Ancylobacter dichloromethanicus]
MIQEPPPLVVEIAWQDPWQAARRLGRREGAPVAGLTFLDSAMRHPLLGRWSYVMAEPFGRFRVEAGVPRWNGEREEGAPLEALRARLKAYAQPRLPGEAGFQAGAAGYVAYEAGRLFDRFPTPQPEPGEGPEVDFGFYDVVATFDVVAKRAFLISTGWPESAPARRARRARERLAEASARLAAPEAPLGPPVTVEGWRSNFDAEGYRRAVARVIDYIRAGDIFQANFTQRFEAMAGSLDPLALYDRLRRANPATFAALIAGEDRIIASSSPERFVKLQGGEVETRPIKGTVPRSVEPTLDAFRGRELTASEKDRAENVMIVDLLRNDLSRVCRPGTVKVPRLCGLETYANVHHLVSVVTGTLQEGRDGLDLMAASFPGGSITGAPKIRAMEIIRELEGRPRGVYCGSIGYIGFDGTMDFNIAIRTVTVEKGPGGFNASFGVGGGITTLSDPAAEHAESLTKAERLFRAFAPEVLP